MSLWLRSILRHETRPRIPLWLEKASLALAHTAPVTMKRYAHAFLPISLGESDNET